MQANRFFGLLLTAVIALAGAPAFAQGTSEARGVVTDPEGNPLPDVKVTFRNTASDTAAYDVSTNKKGRYYVSGLLYYETGRWLVEASLEGYVATKMSVQSRTQTAVVAKFEAGLGPATPAPEVVIRPFGKAEIDFVLTPEDQYVAQAGSAAEEMVEEEPSAPAVKEDPYEAALRLANSGDLEGSIEKFEKAIKEEPEDVERVEAFAKVLYRLDRYDEASAQAQAAIDGGNERVGLYEVLYGVRVAREDYAGAREALDKALAIDSSSRKLLDQAAWLAQTSGDVEGSIDVYERISSLDPGDAEAWVALGGLYAEVGRMDDSRAAYEKVVQIDPSSAYQTFYNIGVLIENKDRPTAEDRKRAIEAYEKAVEIKPDYAAAWKRLAFARLGAGDREGTRNALQKYVELEPDSRDAAQLQAMLKSLGG